LIINKYKAFTVIEFLIASTLTVAVVASSTIGIGLAEKIQRDTYYSDTMNQIGNSLIEGSRALNCEITYNIVQSSNPCKASSLDATSTISNNGDMLFPRNDGNYVYKVSNSLIYEISLKTRWLEAGSNDSCINSNITDLSKYPQPNMILRSFIISGKLNGKPIKTKAKTYNDIQSVGSGIMGIASSNTSNLTYSAGFTASKNTLVTAKLRDLQNAGNVIEIVRSTDEKGCVLFPFIDRNVSIEAGGLVKTGPSGGRV